MGCDGFGMEVGIAYSGSSREREGLMSKTFLSSLVDLISDADHLMAMICRVVITVEQEERRQLCLV